MYIHTRSSFHRKHFVCIFCIAFFNIFSFYYCDTQVELLLGKAYSDWGHVGDAIAIYDQLISTHPDDFRGYLAKVYIFSHLITNHGVIVSFHCESN